MLISLDVGDHAYLGVDLGEQVDRKFVVSRLAAGVKNRRQNASFSRTDRHLRARCRRESEGRRSELVLERFGLDVGHVHGEVHDVLATRQGQWRDADSGCVPLTFASSTSELRWAHRTSG